MSQENEQDFVKVEDTNAEQTDYQALYEQEKEAREKAEAAIIKSKQKSKETKPETQTPEVDNSFIEKFQRLELKTEGIRDEEEIELVIAKSKLLGVTPVEALKDELVKGILERSRKEKLDTVANVGTSSRGKTLERTPERITKDFFKKGDTQSASEMIKAYHKKN